jgi:acid phosphatase
MMENHPYSAIYGTATYMTQLADQYANLQHYSAITYPSEPNYLALAAGQTFSPPSNDDLYHVFDAKNVADGLESVGKTWKVYSETASQSCDTSEGGWVKHNPFVMFKDIVTNSTRCANVVPVTPTTDDEMLADLNSATPSNFIYVEPNGTNDMHDGTVSDGDTYLSGLVPKILASSTFMTKKAALFIVFDEDGTDATMYPNNPVYAVWAGPVVKQHLKSMTLYGHYSFLATLEENWGFTPLGPMDMGAPSMLGEVFQ